jgi:hypothetical protein
LHGLGSPQLEEKGLQQRVPAVRLGEDDMAARDDQPRQLGDHVGARLQVSCEKVAKAGH